MPLKRPELDLKMSGHMEHRKATAADLQEILDIMGWKVRDLAEYWDCTEATIYQWLNQGSVTRGIATWCVRKTLEEARREQADKSNGRRKRLAEAK